MCLNTATADTLKSSKPEGVIPTYKYEVNFPGTLIVIELDTRHLPNKEDEITDDEFSL